MNFHIFSCPESERADLLHEWSEFMKEMKMNNDELKAKLDAIHTELVADNAAFTAAFASLNASIASLTAQLGTIGTTPEVDASLAQVQADADALATLVPAPAA